MASKNIEARAQLFLEGLRGDSKSTMRTKCNKEIGMLKKIYSLATLRSYLTFYRSYSEQNGIGAKPYLRLKTVDNQKIERKYTKKVATQHKSLVKINDPLGMIEKAKELLSSENIYHVVAALCFLTGRRMVEVLKTGQFKVAQKSSRKAWFCGQAKKKGAFGRYKINILGSCSKQVVFAVGLVRAKLITENMSEKQVSSKYSTVVNGYVISLFSDFIGRCTSHDLRKCYATICTAQFKPDNQTTNYFLSTILGHDPDDINTANSYQKYFI